MPFNLGGGELVFILVIVLIVFGAGKLPEVFGQLGKGARTFRDESTATGETKPPTPVTSTATATGVPPGESRGVPPGESKKYCAKCGTALAPDAKFCASCGTPTGTA